MEIKLDYSLDTAAERQRFITELLPNLPSAQINNKKYIEILSDYIISAMTPEEKKSKTILTDNRLITINKRETSYQGLSDSFENGEDGLYNLIIDDKNARLTHKVSISDADLAEIPPLQELKAGIAAVEKMEKAATGKRKFLLKKQLIEMRQEQYIIKNAYKQTSTLSNFNGNNVNNLTKGFSKLSIIDNITIQCGSPVNDSIISFFEPTHISALLCNYSSLKEDVWGKFDADGWYLMEDLDRLVESTLRDRYPLYYQLLIYKIDGRQNIEIQELINNEFGIKYSVEYISSLWRNKIPKMLAEKAKEDYLIWYYTFVEKGNWKKCSRCGQIKLANNRFFSKNNTSKDSFYSICKECRNKKGGCGNG